MDYLLKKNANKFLNILCSFHILFLISGKVISWELDQEDMDIWTINKILEQVEELFSS